MDFEDIRPYRDDEYHKIITELFEIQPLMATIDNYLEDFTLPEIKKMMLSFDTIQEFQSKMVCRFISKIIERSVNNFSYDGILKLDKNESHLLLSNHRDIVLDSALMRPGRFDRQVTVDRPDYAGRLQILNVHA